MSEGRAVVGWLLLTLLLLGTAAAPTSQGPPSAGSDLAEDPRDPALVPVLEGFVTPVLAPGESGRLNFTLRNRYDARILNVNATLEVYSYSTVASSSPVTAATAGHPDLCLSPPQCGLLVSVGEPVVAGRADTAGSRRPIELDVITRPEAPHGGGFDPATYLVRVVVDYTYERVGPNATTLVPLRLISRGHISDAVWEQARKGGGLDIGVLNSTYGSPNRAIAGLATETSFIVREPLPLWPAYLLGGVIVACVAASMILYARREKKRPRGSDEASQERPGEPRE